MEPIYTQGPDLDHVEEYLYTAFNPPTTGFWTATFGCVVGLFGFFLMDVSSALGALRRRVFKQASSPPAGFGQPVTKWFRIFKGLALLSFIGLFLSLTEPFSGVRAGKSAFLVTVGGLTLILLATAVALTRTVWNAWHDNAATIWKWRSLVLMGFVWRFELGASFLSPRSWRTSEEGVTRIARETKVADIWMTPTLVVLDYIVRQKGTNSMSSSNAPTCVTSVRLPGASGSTTTSSGAPT
jgi:hypothetical protein